jgi:hypothetical protein
MDELEKYIKMHRPEFDNERISIDLFTNVHREYRIKQIRKVYLHRVRSIAAVLLVICAFSFSLGWYQNRQIELLRAQIITANNPEFYEAEAYFQREINGQLVLLDSEDNLKLVLAEFEVIDLEIESLKQELLAASDDYDDKVVGALINAYQTKLSILEKVLMKKVNSKEKNEKNETIL